MNGLKGWQHEFPDYPADSMPALPETWQDMSWANDAAPFFLISEGAGVFVDFPDPAQREISEGARFVVVRMVDGAHDPDNGPPLLETDEFGDVLTLAATL